ncbi:glucan biosynthesis protein [Thalassospira profundimaris]|uniref:Glucans biosynthesis protein G n=1 Tax=Thalassospira profundimaris TaxID=502049 RepID=A0A367X6D0_9PROT|nr:glucan biosynthesis protein [Thalassospira profundimaris]RCK49238.1 glucan biosynthesis protein G [Thalassospira profundimaris]
MTQYFPQRTALALKHVFLVALASGTVLLGASLPAYAQANDPAVVTTDPAAASVSDASGPVASAAAPETAAPQNAGDEAVTVTDSQENDAVPGTPQPEDEQKPVVSAPVMFDPEMVIDRARNLAKAPFENPHRELPDVLANLGSDDYDQIRFKSQRAFFNPDNSDFSLELFHPGNMYDVPVAINLVRDGEVQVIPFSAGLFDFGKTGLSGNDFSTQGYAGFRLRYPLSNVDSSDELTRFLGASYFRLQGEGQSIGQMARGLAIDLAGPTGEEIPVFKEFWIVEPKKGDQTITVYGLLDSARVTGAFRFDIKPGTRSQADVKANLFFRDGVEKIGIAPLNGMFLFGEQRRRSFDDYRGEVHSSDGLLINNGRGEWLWRPLDNPVHLQMSSFLDENPIGFGLLQRDRNFDHYQDLDRRFDRQPGYWVKPKGKWGKGHVELVEIPSPSETNDNIVAYWVPETKPVAGGEMTMEYSITAMRDGGGLHDLAQATDTRLMRIASQGDDDAGRARFVLNFAGGDLDYFIKDTKNLHADVSASEGKLENIRVMPDPENGGVRVFFDLVDDSDAASSNLRVFLLHKDKVLSETWTMPWVF